MADTIALSIALALPWLTGWAVLTTLALPDGVAEKPGDSAWRFGAGWFAGVLLLTAWMRVLSLVGVPFGRWSIGVPLVVLAAALIAWRWRADQMHFRNFAAQSWALLRGVALPRWMRVAWVALLIWLTIRAALLLAEVVWQPLYPWDAWIEWATKARVWYEFGRIVPFVPADAWFAAPDLVYFDASPRYPATLPLLQVWANVMLGRWDDALMNVPWWTFGVAFVFVSYAGMRRVGYGSLGALIGAWLIASLPLANVHVALAGYADLPMALYYACAALALLRWLDTRAMGDGVVTLAFALGCLTIKIPGLAWALTLLPGALIALFGVHGRKLLLTLAAIALVAVLVLTRTEAVVLGYRLHLDFAPAWAAIGESLFLLGNWHLMWYGVIVAILLGHRYLFDDQLAPFSAIVLSGLFFLFVVFGFTNAREWVVEQTTVNRAVLHLAPLLCLWALALFNRWRQARTIAPASNVATGAVAG